MLRSFRQKSWLPLATALLASALVTFPAVAQRQPGEFKFEVLSIKPAKRGSGMQVGVPGPAPNGFTATAYLNQLVTFAYGPPLPPFSFEAQLTEIRNLPNWSADDVYVFDARVSQADLKVWQSQGRNRELLRSALRNAIKNASSLPSMRNQRNERCLSS